MTVLNRLVAIPPGAVSLQLNYTVNGGAQAPINTATAVTNINIFAPATVLAGSVRWLDASTAPLSQFSSTQFYTTT